MEELSWRQKAREIWLKEGDGNTGFFHRMENSHKRGNHITEMKINDVWVTEEAEEGFRPLGLQGLQGL